MCKWDIPLIILNKLTWFRITSWRTPRTSCRIEIESYNSDSKVGVDTSAGTCSASSDDTTVTSCCCLKYLGLIWENKLFEVVGTKSSPKSHLVKRYSTSAILECVLSFTNSIGGTIPITLSWVNSCRNLPAAFLRMGSITSSLHVPEPTQ